MRRKAVAKVIQSIRDRVGRGELPADEAQYTIDEIRFYVDSRAGKPKQLRVSGLLGHLADTAIDREFANAGSSVEEEAAYLGVNPDLLRDAGNWQGSVFVDPTTGVRMLYTFGYEGFAQWSRA